MSVMIFQALNSCGCLTKSVPRRTYFWSKKSRKTERVSRTYSVVKPEKVSEQLRGASIPENVSLPPYHLSGIPGPSPRHPTPLTKQEIQRMKDSCSLASQILREASRLATPGVTTDEIDLTVTRLAFQAGAYPSPLNYRNFPKSVCTSVNNVICHGIPDDRPLQSGDIINIDVTVYLDGVHGDCSDTFQAPLPVGDVDQEGQTLVQVARDALSVGVRQCGPGQKFSSIGAAMQDLVSREGLVVVPAFTGHGIGSYFHGPPDIFACSNSYPGVMLPGMAFTIGIRQKVVILSDGWTAVSPDDSRSSQAEHTVLITEQGVEILTL